LVLLVVAGTAGLVAVATSAGPAPAAGVAAVGGHAPPAAASASPAQSPTTHGDLLVGPGETYVIQPTAQSHAYFQGGNITVESGGKLIVENVNLTFVNYVADTGTAQQRLSHIYYFDDFGTVSFENATLTTDVQILNAYAKLNLTVTGVLTAWNTTFAFPGWFYVSGSSADVTLNQSTVTWNPAVQALNEPLAILGDTLWSPEIYVLNGAHFNLFGSKVEHTFADDTAFFGYPRPTPLENTANVHIPNGTGVSQPVTGPSDSANLTLDWSYPAAGALSGYIWIYYDNGNKTNATLADVSFNYGGVNYPLGVLTIPNATTTGAVGSVSYQMPGGVLSSIDSGGMLQFLNYTGAFDTPNEIQVQVNVLAAKGYGAAMNLTQAGFQLNTSGLSYDSSVSGAGSELTAVDAPLDYSWSLPYTNPYSQAPPYPWTAQKLDFTDGAVGYLANVSTPAVIPGVFSASAFVPDSTSQVFFYRWAQFNLSSGSTLVATENARVLSYYTYNSTQSNNATVNALNDLASANPAIWGYVQYWDSIHGVTTYGVSNAEGRAYLLLASSNLTAPSLPNGYFLGAYHIGIEPVGSVQSLWFNWSVSPYPVGVANGTAHYNSPDILSVLITPSSVRLSSVSAPPSTTINLNEQYTTTGVVRYNGTQPATIVIIAYPVSGGNSVELGATHALPGAFTITWADPVPLAAGTTYNLVVTATYNGVSSTYEIPGTYSVPSAPAPAQNFFLQKILGLPLWIWLAIAAAIVVGLVLFLMFARRTAAGKLVECGECGNLIPEDATVCPKCGAEFEKDLIRCSRCASTIPADSKVCPECAAQLLGKPGEGADEPERLGYADYTEKYRADAKRELGENYSEGAFWDWWKRQPTYTSFSQWKLQQGQGAPRTGMSAPPAEGATAAEMPGQPPKGGAGGAAAAGKAAAGAAPAAATGGMTAPPSAPAPPPAGNLKPCPNCGKEIPPEYLVCPFCGAVTQ
jgi:RNA polymerase subunit RPABC4/transcription elongation factor Spt4